MGPVDWGAYPGEHLEILMAVFVAQDHPHVIRRTPASGDKGIDLLIPAGDTFQVQQVKRFTGRIQASEKKQIKKSWDEFVKNRQRTEQDLGGRVVEYALCLPRDPTEGEAKWWRGLTAGAGIPTPWLGAVHWHSMASRHAHVVDYYLHGGKERVVRRSEAIIASLKDPTQRYTAEDAAGAFKAVLTALDHDDPHYHYDFMVTPVPPPPAQLTNCLVAETRSMDDGRFLTVLIRPKHDHSHIDEPIGGTVKLSLPAGSVEAKEFEEAYFGFQHFGRALAIPDGAMAAEFTMPGGLSTSVTGGGGWVGPNLIEGGPKRWKVAVVSPEGEDQAVLAVTTKSLTRGHTGRASELTAVDATGTLTFVLQLELDDNDEPTVRFNISATTIAGAALDEALPSARLLAAMQPPNQLHWRRDHGRKALGVGPVQPTDFLTPGAVQHLEDLAALQEYAEQEFAVPDEVNAQFAHDLRCRLDQLDGKTTTGTWTDVTMTVHDHLTRAEALERIAGAGPLAVEEDILIDYQGAHIELGRFVTVLASANIAHEQPENDRQIRLVPGEDDSFRQWHGTVGSQPPDGT